MPNDPLNEREFELINIVGAKLGANQRDLSKQLDISLGMTNLLVRRLIAKGYIRIRQLNKKKTQYILTPKGFTEKYQKSITYTIKTIRSIGLIRERLHKALRTLYEQGERKFYILGESDLAVLTEMALKEFAGTQQERLKTVPAEILPGVMLICREGAEVVPSQRSVDLIQELANDEAFVNHKSNVQ